MAGWTPSSTKVLNLLDLLLLVTTSTKAQILTQKSMRGTQSFMKIFERVLAPVCLKSHPNVLDFMFRDQHSRIYGEDILLLNQGRWQPLVCFTRTKVLVFTVHKYKYWRLRCAARMQVHGVKELETHTYCRLLCPRPHLCLRWSWKRRWLRMLTYVVLTAPVCQIDLKKEVISLLD